VSYLFFSALAGFWKKKIRAGMEEKKSYGVVMLFVGVFVVFLVCVMSYSLWRDKQINAFMATNRAWGIQCDRVLRPRGWLGTGAYGIRNEFASTVLQRVSL
jgi:hypothetical protein